MVTSKSPTAAPAASTRDRILAAAECLLGQGAADFSMRDLAAVAGLSFATPFNQFGSKLAIMRALSAQRIDLMHTRAATALTSDDAVERVLQVVAIAVAVMLEAPAINRSVMGAIGSPGTEPGDVQARSRALWSVALADGYGLSKQQRAFGLAVLPDQLAISFRGLLSFWTAGEIADADLGRRAIAGASAQMFGLVDAERQDRLADLMETGLGSSYDRSTGEGLNSA
jgi:AcrR family transcriptional regulator